MNTSNLTPSGDMPSPPITITQQSDTPDLSLRQPSFLCKRFPPRTKQQTDRKIQIPRGLPVAVAYLAAGNDINSPPIQSAPAARVYAYFYSP